MAAHHHKPCEVCGNPIQGKPSYVAKRRFCSIDCNTAFQTGENNPNWRGGRVELICALCGSPFLVFPSQVGVNRHCNKQCASASLVGLHCAEKSPRWKGGAKASKQRYRDKLGVTPRVSRPRLCKKCGLPGVKKGRCYHSRCTPPVGVKKTLVKCADCGAERYHFPKQGRLPARCSKCALAKREGRNNANWQGGITPANKRARASDAYREWRRAVFERDDYTCVWCGQRGGKLNADHIKPFAYFPELRFDVDNGRTLCVECHKKTDTYLGGSVKVHRNAQAETP